MTAVLFELRDTSHLPAFVAELERLGSTVSVAMLDAVGDQPAYVRAKPAPLATLLRAEQSPEQVTAFAECQPGVWVEAGLPPPQPVPPPPTGSWLLIRRNGSRSTLSASRFAAEPRAFAIPRLPTAHEPTSASKRWQVSLRLNASRGAELPEVWVLPESQWPHLRALVENSDDRILGQLSLAIGSANQQRVAVLRGRAGREGPPIIVLPVGGYRSHQRFPNLFLPVGFQLQPPLRRDVIRDLLAKGHDRLVWLEASERGLGTLHEIPLTAFRPLNDYVVYTRDRPVQRWSPRPTRKGLFLFGAFEAGELQVKPKPRPGSGKLPAPLIATPGEAEEASPGWLQRLLGWLVPRPTEPEPEPTVAVSVSEEPDVELEELFGLEQSLTEPTEARTDSDRSQIWRQLATAYSRYPERHGDAGLCWLQVLWQQKPLEYDTVRNWFRAERCGRDESPSPQELAGWLGRPASSGTAGALAAYTVWATMESGAAKSFPSQAARIQTALDSLEGELPIRAAWLARLALTRWNGGDLVALARCRDRLLARLGNVGLRLDRDAPGFLRAEGVESAQWQMHARQWLVLARDLIHSWIETRSQDDAALPPLEDVYRAIDGKSQSMPTALAATLVYADLFLAWGLARVGQPQAAAERRAAGDGLLAVDDPVHRYLVVALRQRIDEALRGQSPEPLPSLPPGLSASQSYRIERLKAHSRILEPRAPADLYTPELFDTPQLDSIDATHQRLMSPERLPAREKIQLACSYLALLSQLPPQAACTRLDDFWARFRCVSDRDFSGTHFALGTLRLVEATVLTLTGEASGLNPRIRQWLDDDEFAIRQRIHADMREALEGS